MCSDPNSDFVGGVIGPDGSSDLLFVVWNGTDWLSTEPSEESSTESVPTVNAYCTWRNDSETALFTFVDSSGMDISYVLYNLTDDSWKCTENGETVTSLGNSEGNDGPCNTGSLAKDDIEVLRSEYDWDTGNITLWSVDLDFAVETYIFDTENNMVQPDTELLGEKTHWTVSTNPSWFTYYKNPDAPASKGAIFYSEFGDTKTSLKYRIFDNNDYGAEQTAPALGLGSAVQFVKLQSSTARNDTVAAVSTDDGFLLANVYDATTDTWEGWINVTSIGATADAYNGFDLEVEADSGDVMIVYEKVVRNAPTNRDLYYRI